MSMIFYVKCFLNSFVNDGYEQTFSRFESRAAAVSRSPSDRGSSILAGNKNNRIATPIAEVASLMEPRGKNEPKPGTIENLDIQKARLELLQDSPVGLDQSTKRGAARKAV